MTDGSPDEPMVGALIPCYDSADRVAAVVAGLRRHLSADRILLIDDGSTDHPAARLTDALADGLILLRHPLNRGKGAALRTGFAHALRLGWTAVVTLDADGQHDPDRLPDLVAAFRQTGADLVLGSRMDGGAMAARRAGMPLPRVASNTLTSWLVTKRIGQSVRDSQSGYRLVGRRAMTVGVGLSQTEYLFETALLVRVALAGGRIEHVPIPIRYAGEPSRIRPLRTTLGFAALWLRSWRW